VAVAWVFCGTTGIRSGIRGVFRLFKVVLSVHEIPWRVKVLQIAYWMYHLKWLSGNA